jgi:hypothetical protein
MQERDASLLNIVATLLAWGLLRTSEQSPQNTLFVRHREHDLGFFGAPHRTRVRRAGAGCCPEAKHG